MGMTSDTELCRMAISQAKTEAREKGVILPKKMLAGSSGVFKTWYYVKARDGRALWSGEAHCAYCAKLKVVERYLDADQSQNVLEELGTVKGNRYVIITTTMPITGKPAVYGVILDDEGRIIKKASRKYHDKQKALDELQNAFEYDTDNAVSEAWEAYAEGEEQ